MLIPELIIDSSVTLVMWAEKLGSKMQQVASDQNQHPCHCHCHRLTVMSLLQVRHALEFGLRQVCVREHRFLALPGGQASSKLEAGCRCQESQVPPLHSSQLTWAAILAVESNPWMCSVWGLWEIINNTPPLPLAVSIFQENTWGAWRKMSK